MKKLVYLVAVCLFVSGSASFGDLVAHYEFSENYNDSAGSNDGVAFGDTSIVVDSERGYVASFDGDGDYINLGNNNSLKPSLSITLTAWIKTNDIVDSQQIIALDSQSPNYYGVAFMCEYGGQLATAYCDGGSPGPSSRRSKGDGATHLNINQWYHVAVVMQGPENMQLYVNGIDDGGRYTGSGGSLTYSSAPSFIGSRAGLSYFFDGYIDDVRIYNNALSSQEIMQLVPEPATLAIMAMGVLMLKKKR